MLARRLTVTALAAAGLVAATPAAPAKEISKVAVCGAGSQCNTFTRKDLSNDQMHLLVENAGEIAPPAKAMPWYRIKVTIGPGQGDEGFKPFSYTLAYVPAAGLIRGRGESGEPIWGEALPGAERLIKRMSRGLDAALPASRLTGLDVRPPEAQVSEVFSPAESKPATVTDAGGDTPWTWIALGAAAAAGVGTFFGWRIRHRERPLPAQPSV